MNIGINKICDLKCPYCFAEDYMSCKDDDANMSLENFRKVIDFHKENRMRIMRLIGGEPTLHPDFKSMIRTLNNSKMDEVIEEGGRARLIKSPFFVGVMIFSNGCFSKDILDFLVNMNEKFPEGIKILVNYNGHDAKTQYNESMNNTVLARMLDNIRVLQANGMLAGIGINFYRPDIEYKRCLKLVTEMELDNIRVSVPAPNTDETRNMNPKDYYMQFRDSFYEFIKACKGANINPSLDCNTIPACVFTPEQLRYMSLVLMSKQPCSEPVLDVTTDLSVLRCFGLSDVSIKPDNLAECNMEKLVSDMKALQSSRTDRPRFEECNDCDIYERFKMGCGCHAFCSVGKLG